jgi:hypothetical protein
MCNTAGKVHDCFGVAAGLCFRQQWFNDFWAMWVEKMPHLAGFIRLGCRSTRNNSSVFIVRRTGSSVIGNTCNAAGGFL